MTNRANMKPLKSLNRTVKEKGKNPLEKQEKDSY